MTRGGLFFSRHALLAAFLCACKKDVPLPPELAGPNLPSSSRVVAEIVPRCRNAGHELVLPGDDVVVGDAILWHGSLYLGLIHRVGATRTGAILKAPLDLATSSLVEVGPSFGDDPPPSPRAAGADLFVAFYTRKRAADAGTIGKSGATRELAVEKFGGENRRTVLQQEDESTAFDLAFAREGAAVAWDEDAPIPAGQFLADRGQIRVQLLGDTEKARVASPFASDAEAPKLLARPGPQGGYWLAWLARRVEDPDAGLGIEGPGENRAFRWVEVATLDAKANVVGSVRRISPEKGRVVSFDLRVVEANAELVVLAQDEAAPSEGAGARVIRFGIGTDGTRPKIDTTDLVVGLGRSITDLVPASSGASWLAWTDATEHAHLLPLGATLVVAGGGTREPALDGARVIAGLGAGGLGKDQVWSLAASGGGANGRVLLRALVCDRP